MLDKNPDLRGVIASRLGDIDEQLAKRAAAELLQTRTERDPDQRLRVESVLRDRTFHPVFQPIYSLETGALLAVEALTRFTGEPQQGPDRWFADAERSGLGAELELAAVDESLLEATGLPTGVKLAVNLSPGVVADYRLPEYLGRAPAGSLIVEITEHAPVEDYQLLTGAIAALRSAHDIRVAIDDAGAGFSSLRHIVQLGPDVIKLDMSLTRNIHLDPVRHALAASLVGFATTADIRLVAEGVETVEELRALQELHVHAAQGYLLGRPSRVANIPPATVLPVSSAADKAHAHGEPTRSVRNRLVS